MPLTLMSSSRTETNSQLQKQKLRHMLWAEIPEGHRLRSAKKTTFITYWTLPVFINKKKRTIFTFSKTHNPLGRGECLQRTPYSIVSVYTAFTIGACASQCGVFTASPLVPSHPRRQLASRRPHRRGLPRWQRPIGWRASDHDVVFFYLLLERTDSGLKVRSKSELEYFYYPGRNYL